VPVSYQARVRVSYQARAWCHIKRACPPTRYDTCLFIIVIPLFRGNREIAAGALIACRLEVEVAAMEIVCQRHSSMPIHCASTLEEEEEARVPQHKFRLV
jgi:hypothetical protein